jgi:SpoVK/Ycf46/Vps4 family AAA+-type ATPase
MNPTIYREMQSGEILKEPINVTDQIFSTDQDWQKWAERQQVTIVQSGSQQEKLLDGARVEGFREAVIRMKEVIPSHMIGLQWELHKLYLNTL